MWALDSLWVLPRCFCLNTSLQALVFDVCFPLLSAKSYQSYKVLILSIFSSLSVLRKWEWLELLKQKWCLYFFWNRPEARKCHKPSDLVWEALLSWSEKMIDVDCIFLSCRGCCVNGILILSCVLFCLENIPFMSPSILCSQPSLPFSIASAINV